jgi:tRNA(Ile)-lysidine synthase
MNRRSPDQQPRVPESFQGESGLVQRVRQFLRGAFPGTRPHLLVGYSGGQDSAALLLVLRELERLGACRLAVVHVDHALRPDSAEAAVRAVSVGRGLGLEVRVHRTEAPLYERFPGRSVEDAARSFRYQVLARVAAQAGADAIVVGHHARDQAETVLLHILRGSGLAGLAGMAADSVLPVPGSGSGERMRVVRPFLHEAPEVLAGLVARSGLPVIEDPSNADPAFRRNRVRHELLPLLEDIAPGAVGRVVSLADILRADEAALDDAARVVLARAADEVGALSWGPVRGVPVGLQRRVVRRWLLGHDPPGELGRERVDAVIGLAGRDAGGKRVEIGDGWQVAYVRGRLTVVRPEAHR